MTTSTTLMAFYLQTSHEVTSVELLGSWDNFSQPYKMERDVRVGRGQWRGCHVFRNIICDGRTVSSNSKRDGGLKMGGKYWYYYRLNDDLDSYNPNLPTTTNCPLMPGQVVNVLDVPVYLGPEDARDKDGLVMMPMTMNPQDKYLNPRPPPEKPDQRLNASSASLNSKPGRHSSSSLSGDWSRISSTSSTPRTMGGIGKQSGPRKDRPPYSKRDAGHKPKAVNSETNSPKGTVCKMLAYPTKNIRRDESPAARSTPPGSRNEGPAHKCTLNGSSTAVSTNCQEKNRGNVNTSHALSTLFDPTVVEEHQQATAKSKPFRPCPKPSLPNADILNKRLPALPNSPTSAVHGVNVDVDTEHEPLKSHFSDWTVTTMAISDSLGAGSPCEPVPPLKFTSAGANASHRDEALRSPESLVTEPATPELSDTSDGFSDEGWSLASPFCQGPQGWELPSYSSQRLEMELDVAIHGLRIENATTTFAERRRGVAGTRPETPPMSPHEEGTASALTMKRKSRIMGGLQIYKLSNEQAPSDTTLRLQKGSGRGLEQIYSLPPAEHSSESTLKKTNSVIGGDVSGEHQDGRFSVMTSLIDDLGYLGSIIV